MDGLGWELLRDHPAAAPFLSELALRGGPLAAGFPSTTVTSLASLGTGRPPGVHGMLGYQVAVPGTGRILNGLRWDSRVDPVTWQPEPTIYERAAAAGIGAFQVAAGAYQKSGLTQAVWRGADYRRADSPGALAAQAGAALRETESALVTVYLGDLDATGHAFGCGSDAWYYQLGHVDKLAEQLASVLPSGAQLYVTADHGMLDISPDRRVDVDALADLRKGVALLGGEPRARHVYAEPGAAGDVLAAWRDVLGERAWVLSRDEAINGRLVRPGRAPRDRPDRRRGSRRGRRHRHRRDAGRAARVGPGRHARLAHQRRAAGAAARARQPVNGPSPRAQAPRPRHHESAGQRGRSGPRTGRAAAPVLLDVRWRLGGPPGIDSYRAGHLPSAVFADLDRDLSGPPGPGGRHPLPSAADFQAAMRRAGVSDGRPVVAYDDGDAAAAARAWWLLRYFGHRSVRVLDGGFRAWQAAGQPLTTAGPAAEPGDFTARPGHMPLLDAAGASATARSGVLLDARAAERYRGETEPVDPVAGHIPGAVSAPAAGNVTGDGSFLAPAELRERFAALGARRACRSARTAVPG